MNWEHIRGIYYISDGYVRAFDDWYLKIGKDLWKVKFALYSIFNIKYKIIREQEIKVIGNYATAIDFRSRRLQEKQSQQLLCTSLKIGIEFYYDRLFIYWYQYIAFVPYSSIFHKHMTFIRVETNRLVFSVLMSRNRNVV